MITSLQVLGQVAFHFRLSIAQILLSLGTCAVLEIAITSREAARDHVAGERAADRQRRRVRPARARARSTATGGACAAGGSSSATRGGVAALEVRDQVARRAHLQPVEHRARRSASSSSGAPAPSRSTSGGGRCRGGWRSRSRSSSPAASRSSRRLSCCASRSAFWAAFAVGIGVLALAGHAMTARWHLGPITGWHFWWVLVTSPEVLVFLFFMITDPKTAPRGGRARASVYAVTLGLLAALLIAPTPTEFAAKVALLGALAIVCAARPLPRVRAARARSCSPPRPPRAHTCPRSSSPATAPARSAAAQPLPPGALPPITILPSQGVQTQLDLPTAERSRTTCSTVVPAARRRPHHAPPRARAGPGAAVRGRATRGPDVPPDAERQRLGARRRHRPRRRRRCSPATRARGHSARGRRAAVGLDFTQGSFRYGISNESKAMMGGGVCWLDYNSDGWLDLFAVNSYASADTPTWEAHGGLPRSRAVRERRAGASATSRARRTRDSPCRATAASPPT